MSTMTVGTKRPKKNIAYDGKRYGRISANAVIGPVAKLGQQCAGHLKYGRSNVKVGAGGTGGLSRPAPAFSARLAGNLGSSKYLP